MKGRVVAACALAATCLFGAPTASAESVKQGECKEVKLPVSLASGGPNDQTLAGTLCEPDTWAAGSRQVDVLVPGYTYNRSYWDWSQDPARYSFVDKELSAGRATFAYDRLGTGMSSHPSALSLTPQSDAYELHQVMGWARRGYSKVNLIGHSWGSYIGALETNQYNDADRLVITGLVHSAGIGFVLLEPSMIPAPLDSEFAGEINDPLYVTTRPGTRATLFYHDADPSVIAHDEATKDVGAQVQLAVGALQHFFTPPALNETKDITRPVLLVVGQQDALFCGLLLDCTKDAAVQANETPFYPAAGSLTIKTVPDTGHDLPLHPTADQSFNDINAWLATH